MHIFLYDLSFTSTVQILAVLTFNSFFAKPSSTNDFILLQMAASAA